MASAMQDKLQILEKEPNSILRHVKEMSSQNYMTQYENMEQNNLKLQYY